MRNRRGGTKYIEKTLEKVGDGFVSKFLADVGDVIEDGLVAVEVDHALEELQNNDSGRPGGERQTASSGVAHQLSTAAEYPPS